MCYKVSLNLIVESFNENGEIYHNGWTAQNASPTTKNYTYDVSQYGIVTGQRNPAAVQWLAPAWGNRLLDRGTPYARLVCMYWPRAALYTLARESWQRDLINGSVTSVSWFWKYGWRLLHCLSEKFKFGKKQLSN